MLAFDILKLGVFLQLIILVRGLLSGNLKRFVYFYVYIAAGCAEAIAGYEIFRLHHSSYNSFYWGGQFVTLFVGCGLILQIFDKVLEPYAGAEKFARMLCFATFAAIFLFGLVYPYLMPSVTPAGSEIELERDVRTAQILFFVAIVTVIFYYAIPLGKNMKGMIWGYGLYLGVSMTVLALQAYEGTRFDPIWNIVQPLSFDVSLFVWMIAFWAYYPNPVPRSEVRLESDYKALAVRTRRSVDALRSYFGRWPRL